MQPFFIVILAFLIRKENISLYQLIVLSIIRIVVGISQKEELRVRVYRIVYCYLFFQ